MKIKRSEMPMTRRLHALRSWLDGKERRLGLVTSLDGSQLITLVLDPRNRSAECWETPVEGDQYPSLTPSMPQCHWFERAIWDLFGLQATGHPRLKNLFLHDQYEPDFQPLRTAKKPAGISAAAHRKYEFLKVQGDGVYEIPVGPIHAGIIEPGHFRLSCLGEIILNLEIQLGFLHRGVEKRLTAVPWPKARFVAEAASSDTAVGNALAHAVAIETLINIECPPRAQHLRSLALEIERLAMHIIDVGGIGVDIGYLGVAASMGRLRGNALRLGDLIAGSRFMRGFILPGGVFRDPDRYLPAALQLTRELRKSVEPVTAILLDNPVACERLADVGRVSTSLARDFGLVGVASRASGINYDARQHFPHGAFPEHAPPPVVETSGDALARTKVRIGELFHSLRTIEKLIESIPSGPIQEKLPEILPGGRVGVGIVEAFRGELIHLVFTNNNGQISRYAIKDPSFNNWTGVSIGVRNNLVADFPICNKSFSLSYSGHDL